MRLNASRRLSKQEEERDQSVVVLNNSGMSPLQREGAYQCMFSNGSIEEANLVYDDFNLRGNSNKMNNIISDTLPPNLLENNDSTIPHQEEDDGTFCCSILMDSIPVIRELMVLSEAEAGGTIPFNSFFKLLRKLRLTSSQQKEYLNKSTNLVVRIAALMNVINSFLKTYQLFFQEFFLYFSREIKTINLSEISVTELIMRLGLELFRVLGKEKLQLELRDIMNYNKKHRDLDIDFIQLLEMFDFYDNVYSGAIKKKQTIVQFFQNCVSKLVGAVKSSFIFELQDLLKSNQLNQHNSLQQSKTDSSTSTLKLKVYDNKDRETRNIHKRVLKNVETKLEKESIQGLLQKNFNVNFEVALEDNGFEKEDHVESEIEDYFLENRPKNKGWLFRKSKKHQNKWSNLFFYIYHDNSHLVSVKPTTLKREMDCENIELFKCSFIELLDYQEAKKACMERRKCRNKNNFLSVTEGQTGGTINNTNSNDGRLLTQTARKNEMQNFFLYDKSSKKHYLIRSEESLIIMSIISFYNKTLGSIDKGDKIHMAELAQFYSEYSGIIEIALCKKQQLNQSYTDLSSFAFKPQYLIIKQGKCRIYNMKQKDKIDLMEYELKIDSSLPFTPSNPFSFLLEKIIANPPEANKQEDKRRDDQSQVSQQSSVVMFNPQTGHADSRRISGFTSGIDSKNPFGGRQGSEQKTQSQPSQGIFSKLFSRIYKKTPERLVIASDSEYKRKQWIFAINFHKTLLVRMKKKNKSSFGFYQSFNTNQFFSNQNTLENENTQQHNPSYSNVPSNMQQQQSQQGNHQYGFSKRRAPASYGRIMGFNNNEYGTVMQMKPSFKLSEIEGDNDYYDIFAQKDIVEEVKEEEEEHNDDSPKLPQYNHSDMKEKYQQDVPRTHHSRQGSNHQGQEFQQAFAPQNNTGSANKNSILKTTEEGMYTMSFPMNNPLFKKSLLVQDSTNMIPNSKEIRTISDEEIWQKFLKHFLSSNHQYSEIDLSALTSEHYQQININSDHKVSNSNTSQRKGDNFEQQRISQLDLKQGANKNGRRLPNNQNYQSTSEFLNVNRRHEHNEEMQSIHKYYQDDDDIQPSRNDEVESDEEPQAQSINFRNTFVHKMD